MDNAIIIGGSSGLGLEIAKIFNNSNIYKPVIFSRNRKSIDEENLNIKHEECDLEEFSIDSFINLFCKYKTISAICFSQRCRNNSNKNIDDFYTKEYKVMVRSISRALDAFNIYKKENCSDKISFFTRILIIGSTYSNLIGLDQDSNYHACKFAQLGLVKFYALQSKSNYNINMLSPATYIKKGAEQYWEDNLKSKIWSNYPMNRLAKVNDIAKEAYNILTLSSEFTSGNNIIIDSGVSNLYNDQQIN